MCYGLLTIQPILPTSRALCVGSFQCLFKTHHYQCYFSVYSTHKVQYEDRWWNVNFPYWTVSVHDRFFVMYGDGLYLFFTKKWKKSSIWSTV